MLGNKMARSVLLLGLLVFSALSAQTTARVIGFPLYGVRTNVVEFNMTDGSETKLMELLNYATAADPWSGASDPESNTVYFHGLELPAAFDVSLVKVDLTTKTVQSLPLADAHNYTNSQAFYHSASKTVYEIMSLRNPPAKADVYLVQVDFASKSRKIVKKYDAFDGVFDAFLVPEGTGSIIASVRVKNAPSKTVSIDLTSGDYMDVPQIKFNGEFLHLQWLAIGWNVEAKTASILTLDTSYMVNNQRNVSVFHWNVGDGTVVRAGLPFLFPPKDSFFGSAGLVASTFDIKTGAFFASFSDRSSKSGILQVDAATGKQMAFTTFEASSEARQITTL